MPGKPLSCGTADGNAVVRKRGVGEEDGATYDTAMADEIPRYRCALRIHSPRRECRPRYREDRFDAFLLGQTSLLRYTERPVQVHPGLAVCKAVSC